MAQTIEEQIATIDRALGERMIWHALVILRAWMSELGENNPYEQAYEDIRTQYTALFENWLTSDDPEREQRHDALTGDTYRLVDAVYASLRLQRGLSPQMHGFNPDNAQSVIHYFSFCLQFKDSDYVWLQRAFNNPDQSAVALMAVAALSHNIRECFNEKALLVLIEGINADNEIVAEQCLANTILLLAHYDIRLDYFPRVQAAFEESLAEQGDEGEMAFQVLCALVMSLKAASEDGQVMRKEVRMEDLPGELQDLMELTDRSRDMNTIVTWMPSSELDYMQGLVQILPDTWVFGILVGENQERVRNIAYTYLSVGFMDLMWDHLDEAIRWLRNAMRKGTKAPLDYINAGHCMMLKGDRIMAYEYYKQARNLCKGAKEFFNLFRPDRSQLVDRGVSLEQVYLIEDQLINA